MLALSNKLSRPPLLAARACREEALQAVLAIGVLPGSRNAHGESLLELAARKGCSHTCAALLDLGADPFEDTLCSDEFGLRARLRGFESMIAANLGSCALRAAANCSPLELNSHRQEWHDIQDRTHAQVRLWRRGASWMHLAAAARAPRSICALGVLGLDPNQLDGSGSSPLHACVAASSAHTRPVAACVEALLRLGAYPCQANPEGERPADSMPSQWLGMAARSEARLLDASLGRVPARSRHPLASRL